MKISFISKKAFLKMILFNTLFFGFWIAMLFLDLEFKFFSSDYVNLLYIAFPVWFIYSIWHSVYSYIKTRKIFIPSIIYYIYSIIFCFVSAIYNDHHRSFDYNSIPSYLYASLKIASFVVVFTTLPAVIIAILREKD